MTYEYNVSDIVGQTITIPMGSSVPYTICYFKVNSYNSSSANVKFDMYLQHNYTGIGTLSSYRCDKDGVYVQSYSTREDLYYNNYNPIKISYYGTTTFIPLNTETVIFQTAVEGGRVRTSEIRLKLNLPKINFNRNSIKDVYFNGTKANHIYFNGTQIQ